MNKKIITLLIILLFSVSIVAAEENTTEDAEIKDMANYITPISISNNGIKFSDDFTGFCLDLTKGDLTTSDGFTSKSTGSNTLQNYIKLAIIECYKQSKENEIGSIVASFCDGSYKNSNNELITAVLNSHEKIGDSAVVDIDNTTEATFNFELLKSSDNEKSDCLAYRVSMKTVAGDDVLGAPSEDSQAADNTSGDEAQDTSNDAKTDDKAKDATSNDDTKDSKKEKAKSNDDEPITNETNKTIINNTTTVIIHEQNTTVITNNVKNDTPQNTLLKTAGNPLFILVVVIAVIAIVVFEKHRRG